METLENIARLFVWLTLLVSGIVCAVSGDLKDAFMFFALTQIFIDVSVIRDGK